MTVASLSLVDAVRVCAWPRGGGRGLAARAAGRSSTRCPTAASRCAGGRLLRAHRVPPAGSRRAASARGERCGGAPAAGANGGGRVGPHVQLPTGMPRVDAPARRWGGGAAVSLFFFSVGAHPPAPTRVGAPRPRGGAPTRSPPPWGDPAAGAPARRPAPRPPPVAPRTRRRALPVARARGASSQGECPPLPPPLPPWRPRGVVCAARRWCSAPCAVAGTCIH